MPIVEQVIDWLLDADPAIRWQVLRDLTGTGKEVVASERARVAHEGWGARLLDLQSENGMWGGGAYSPKWTSTTYTLLLLRHLGIDPADSRVREATDLVRELVVMGHDKEPFFEYRTEICMTGMSLALASYFLEDARGLPQPGYLLSEQRDDGGWNCDVESDRSSFHTTISVLEGMWEHEQAIGGDVALSQARARAHEYLLERRLMFRRSTGEQIDQRWRLLAFPPRWHYDILRALDYFRDAGVDPDPRCEQAIEVVEKKRRKEGTWPLQNRYSGRVHFEMEEGAGKPSRWNTLRALRVLDWHGAVH